MVSGVKSLTKANSKVEYKRKNKEANMANEQTNPNEYIAQVVAEASRATIQTMFMASAAIAENTGPKVGIPILKHPTFNSTLKTNTVN